MTAQLNLRRKFNLTLTETLTLMEMSEGKVVSRDEIRSLFFSTNYVSEAAVPTHIYRINKAIAPLKISNVRAKGYKLEGENLTEIQKIMGGG